MIVNCDVRQTSGNIIDGTHNTKCYDVLCLTPSMLLNLEGELHNVFVCNLQVFLLKAANIYSEMLKDISNIFSLKHCQIV